MAVRVQNKGIIHRILLWGPVILCMGTIFYASSQPAAQIPFIFSFQDIVFHLLAYAVLAFFFVRALKNTFPKLKITQLVLFTVIFGIFYGVSDEIHQLFVPGRNCTGFDIFVDGLGSLIGSLVYR